jgi:dGTP triphosphohydrolase
MTEEPNQNPVGRPTKYRPDYHPVWAAKLAKLGATDEEIAGALDIAVATLYAWRNVHPEFLEALKGGKIMADAEVASKLFHRATGYEHPDVDIKVVDGQIVITDLVKHYPPDTTAAIFWLKNRRPDLWREKAQENETSNMAQLVADLIKKLPG